MLVESNNLQGGKDVRFDRAVKSLHNVTGLRTGCPLFFLTLKKLATPVLFCDYAPNVTPNLTISQAIRLLLLL